MFKDSSENLQDFLPKITVVPHYNTRGQYIFKKTPLSNEQFIIHWGGAMEYLVIMHQD